MSLAAKRMCIAVLMCLGAPASSVCAQDAASGWFQRSDRAKAEQPHWITPLATTTPRLEQEFRYDLAWQDVQPGAPHTSNFGGGKGLELIPLDRVEVIAGVPAYIAHHDPALADGFGDIRVLVKYRLFASTEEHGNYIVTAFLDMDFPTGSSGNGVSSTVMTPTLAYGKGFGAFDVQGTFGVGLPTANEAQIGRSYAWNNAVQYHLLRVLWPEVEVNATWLQDGKNAGRQQVYVTPGVVAGRFPLAGRVALTVGFGVQIAVSEFHASQHNVVFSARLPF